MKVRKSFVLGTLIAIIFVVFGVVALKWRGFRATSTPTAFEADTARFIRDLAIPRAERQKKSPFAGDSAALEQGREYFLARCASCQGVDARGRTSIGANVYPRVPDLHGDATQDLTDGEIHYIIENGIQFTGMPAMGSTHREFGADSWKLVAYIRNLRSLTPGEISLEAAASASAHYTGSQSCQKCHAEIYERWKKTPMANVVRDPREQPDAIIPDLNSNTVAKFTKDQVALV